MKTRNISQKLSDVAERSASPTLAIRSLNCDEAQRYVGGQTIFRAYLADGWLTAYAEGDRLRRFDIRDLDACIDRHHHEQPPSLRKGGAEIATPPCVAAT